MKKLMMISVTVLLFGVANAQTQTPAISSPMPATQQKGEVKESGWTKVESAQIPVALQQTLKEDKYTGWENSGVYYNKSTNQYSADTKTGTISNTFRFDSNGQSITATRTYPNVLPAGSPTVAPDTKPMPIPVPNP